MNSWVFFGGECQLYFSGCFFMFMCFLSLLTFRQLENHTAGGEGSASLIAMGAGIFLICTERDR